MMLLDALIVGAALGQGYNLWRLSKLHVPAVGLFLTHATFLIAEVWMAMDGLTSMYLWALISLWSVLMSTKAMHEKYFKGKFDGD